MKKENVMFKSLQFGFVASLALFGFGCSDGGNYDQGTSATAIAEGTVAQGKVKSAKVCADLNFNNLCDTGEPFTFTQAPPAFAGRYIIRNIPTNTPYQFVTVGGTDVLTNKQARPMKARFGMRNITPITTLVAQAKPAQQAALTTMLDNLSGGQGYDIDISSAQMPPEFLSLVKITEQTLTTLETVGLSSAVDQAKVMEFISTELLAQPLNVPTNTLGTIFAEVATQIATSGVFTDFEVPAGDTDNDGISNAVEFSQAFGALANQIQSTVESAVITDITNPNFGTVKEDQALQDNIATSIVNELATIDAVPVGSVTLSVYSVKVKNSTAPGYLALLADSLTNNDNLSVAAGDLTTVEVVVRGDNSFTPPTAKNYQNSSFSLSVSESNSNRSLAIVVSGVNVAVNAAGAVTLTGGTTIELRGVNSNGSLVVQKTLSNVANFITFSASTPAAIINLNIAALRVEIETAEVGSIGAKGTYNVNATISGAPGVPAALALTVN